MIRARVNNGFIQPLEPLPAEWQNGREVVVADLADQPGDGAEDFTRWAEDMKRLTAGLNGAGEWEQIEAALAEADRQSKALVRREMGIP